MKKYKMYKENIISDNLIKAKGLDVKPIKNSILISLLSGVVAVNLFKFFSDDQSKMLLSCASLAFSLPLSIFSIKNLKIDYDSYKAKKRISKLKETLLKKGIKVDFLSCNRLFNQNTFLLKEGFIKYYDEDDIIYYDPEHIYGIDISYDVNESLMPKRKFKKYNNNIIKK